MKTASFSDRLKQLREEKEMTQADLARIVGVDKSSIFKWENGDIKSVKSNKIADLAHALDVSPAYLMGWEEPPKDEYSKIPVYGDVPAGIPGGIVSDIIDYEDIPRKMAGTGDYFGLRVRGESMMPRIRAGDVVIVRRQDAVDNGQIAVIVVNGDEYTLKTVKFRGGLMILQPMNPAYDPIAYTAEEIEMLPVRIVGRVVELRAKF